VAEKIEEKNRRREEVQKIREKQGGPEAPAYKRANFSGRRILSQKNIGKRN
jgi:hypothetical protein